LVGEKRTPLALSLTGYIVSIPVFCDSGFIVLVPLAKALARKAALGRLTLAVCLATGLYATHCLVPPTPGPIAAALALGADMGKVILLGLPVALLLALAGYFWAMRFRAEKLPDEELGSRESGVAPVEALSAEKLPGAFKSMLPILAPLVLITLGSMANIQGGPFGSGLFASMVRGAGHPVFALAAGMLLSFPLASGAKSSRGDWIAAAIKSTAIVLTVTAAGGAFGQVIRSSQLSATLQEVLGSWKAGVLAPFLLAAALKSAQGSSTVAMITTSAIVLPLLGPLGLGAEGWGPALAVLAIGCGSMAVSHANDSYFWVVSQMAGIPVNTAYRVYTSATGLMGLCGALITLLLAAVLLP
jgi:GntP family gluconate:H+ symporter